MDGPCAFIRNMSPAIVNAALKQLRGPLGTVKTKSAVFTMFRCLVLATKVREGMEREGVVRRGEEGNGKDYTKYPNVYF